MKKNIRRSLIITLIILFLWVVIFKATQNVTIVTNNIPNEKEQMMRLEMSQWPKAIMYFECSWITDVQSKEYCQKKQKNLRIFYKDMKWETMVKPQLSKEKMLNFNCSVLNGTEKEICRKDLFSMSF